MANQSASTRVFCATARGIAAIMLLSTAAPLRAGDMPVRPTLPETWSATDGLGRRIDPARYPAARPDRFVGIFYFLWMQGGPNDHVFDITRILAADPDAPKWGNKTAFHWWAQPYFGYYRSDDAWVIAKHAQLLSDAGVDVVIFDVTNAYTYDATLQKVCDVYTRLRSEGRRTPQIAFIAHARSAKTVTHLYDTFFAANRYPQLWFRWKGKPLMMASAEGLAPDVADFFTLRESWAWTNPGGWFKDGRGKWPWLDNTPQKWGWDQSPERPEEMPVAVAQHPVTPVGRSFHDGKQPPPDQAKPGQGLYFAEQWKRAIDVDPEFIFVTGWNEWIAQRFLNAGDKSPKRLGYATLKPGDTFFVDAYSQEFSRDIEPMAGGHGDNYYYQLVDGIRRFKGVPAAPVATGPRTIKSTDGFASWQTVTPAYLDDVGDTAARDEPGYGDAGRLMNDTGRNDFETCRATWDAENVYFYVRTSAPLTPPSATNWMTLLIDIDGDGQGGCNGYDLAINRTAPHDGRTAVERYLPGKGWTPCGQARVVFSGQELQLAVPRSLFPRSEGGRLRFGFKWADNVSPESDPVRFIDQGDVAPNGRFNYRFDSGK